MGTVNSAVPVFHFLLPPGILLFYSEKPTGESILFIIVTGILIALVFLMLFLSGIFSFGRKVPGADMSAALRDLLLARANGKIGQEEFDRGQAALHASLLDTATQVPAVSPHLRWVVPVFFIVAASAVYLYADKSKVVQNNSTPLTSSRVIVSPSTSPQQQNPQANSPPAAQVQANSGGDLNMMVKRLADKMLKNPGNGDGWLLLARTYGELRQAKEAANAYAKAAAMLPPDATLLADWADARVVTNERKWDAQSRDIVKRALAIDPKHLKALSLAGSEAFERADYKAAIVFWKRILEVAPADSMDAKLAEKNIQEAKDMLAGKKSG